MPKVLVIGAPAPHLKLENILGEGHVIKVVYELDNIEKVFCSDNYHLVIASENGHAEELTKVLKFIRSKSKEAYILIALSDKSGSPKTIAWLETLAKEVGIDACIPYDPHGKFLNIIIINAATRMNQRQLGSKFDELAQKLLLQLK